MNLIPQSQDDEEPEEYNVAEEAKETHKDSGEVQSLISMDWKVWRVWRFKRIMNDICRLYISILPLCITKSDEEVIDIIYFFEFS